MSVLDVATEYAALAADTVDEETGEVLGDAAALARLDALAGTIAQRVDGVAAALRRLEAEADALTAEANRLLKRAKSRHARAARLEVLLGLVLSRVGERRIETPHTTIYTQANQPSVVIDDADALPTELVSVVVERRPDKRAIRAAIEAGEEVPGARLERSERTVIK